MRTRYFRRPVAFCDELPLPSRDIQRQALTRGAVLARLLQMYGARVERLALAVENSEYNDPAAALSAAMLSEHFGG